MDHDTGIGVLTGVRMKEPITVDSTLLDVK